MLEGKKKETLMDQTKWCAKAIQQIKEFLSVAPVLTMPDPKEAHNSPLV